MKKVLKNIVALVREHPAGIPLKKLSMYYQQKYHTNMMSLSELGFDSMFSLVASLHKDLVMEGQLVFHREHRTEARAREEPGASSSAGDGAKAQTSKGKIKKSDEVRKNLLEMMEQHPGGILLSKVAIVYSQTFHQNLTVASLGFSSMSDLIESLKDDLVVKEGLVFHRSHLAQNQPDSAFPAEAAKLNRPNRAQTPPSLPRLAAEPQREVSSQCVNLTQLPLMSTPTFFSGHISFGDLPTPASRPAEKLSQEELHQRVIQVMKKHQVAAPSMDQLQQLYRQQFGEQFPMQQYMSLYDSVEARKPPAQPELAAAAAAAARPSSTWQIPAATKNPEEQGASGPFIFQGSDFPALGDDRTATTEEKKSKVKKIRIEPAAPVFREGYHAQLRDVLGGNMRAVEAMEDEDLRGLRSTRNWVNTDSVNSLMEGVIRQIAAEGELVTEQKVVSRVCSLNPTLNPGSLKPRTYPALKDLQYIMREINIFIECTEAVSSICTLYELGQALAGLKDKKRYEELNLGPLCKLPMVHRMFKISANTKDDDVCQIETVDILKQLNSFRRNRANVRVDLAEFMKHLADHYNCDSPYELGIRIHSVALPIATISKVRRNEHAILEQAREVILKELEEETTERLRKLKKNVLEPVQNAASFSSACNLELRKKYASMTAAEVVLEVFTNAQGVFSPKKIKHAQNFLLEVSADRLAMALFQLAVCGGSLAPPQDLVLKEKAPKATEQTQANDKSDILLPSEAKVKQFLKDSLSAQNSAITLAHIASLEKKVAKHFQVKDFLSLEKGSFLDFLVKNIQLLQDSLGSALILSSGGGAELSGTGFKPTRQDVFEFIKHCGDVTSTDPDELSYIEAALRSHYRVRDSRDLGYGPLHMLAGLVKRQKALLGGGLSPVYYESAMFAKLSKSSSEGGTETVGRLGEVSRAQALACLLSCPLLEDLSEWSQWELIFKPVHGCLKDFIERHAANTGLAALEVTPGLLLRITTTTHTSDRHFSSAAEALDPVGAAGHLVSMAVADGIANTPTALLANHMERALAAAMGNADLFPAEEDGHNAVAKFLLACLTRIPARICQALLQQVFLEPFSRVVGQAVSKGVLITAAQSDPKHLNCLHRLGILMGITDWVRDYQKKLDPDRSHSYSTCSAPSEQAKSNLIDSESSSQSALNMSEDEFLEESVMDDSSVFPQLNHSSQPVNGEQDGGVEEEEEDEEELYELVSPADGETSDMSSEADGARGEEESPEKSDSDEKDAGSCQSETALDPHRAVIEDIRKSEFGIGVELTAEGQKLMQVHQERLGRSLDRLSTELYSKDTHFVLELIQNADDNGYPSEAGVIPALAFVVEKDCITVLNNETGFQEKNIRAICDVGRSTKGKHKYGYIGQKGIGFKSVFKVTDCPEIHSNGFHLRFDKTCGPMGYILPHWSEDERPLGAQLKDVSQHSWTTKISLPLRTESQQTRNLFHDVHPSLLLFLHRLRSITICNQSEKRVVTMTRKDLSHNVLEVEHTDGVERWLVVKSTLRPTAAKTKEDVESTELALAFQLGGDTAGSDAACQPQKQPVFAYLPLRSFGFRFIIQADFDIPSSREDVDRDSSWNQWLRSEIPKLFLQAMDVFTDHPEFKGLKGLCHFLQFVPLPDEVLDFFKPVAGKIIQLLKGKAFLPTQSSDGTVVLKFPSQVAVCQDAVIRDVIGGAELERHLSLSYLHPGLSPAPPASLLAHLGVRSLRGSDVTTVTTAMAKELMRVEGIHSDGGLRQLAKLLVCNFRALEHGYGEADSVLETLRDLPIIPLADGRVVALSGEGVFFPLEESTTKKKKAQSQKGPLSALYQDVSVVHPSLLNCLEPLECQQVRELLRRLGVHELEPQELLEQHIYPTIRSNKWKTKPEPVVVSYLVFIKQHSSSSQEDSDAAIPVLTNRGLLCPAEEKVHFSPGYGNIDLPTQLPGCDWILLDSCYVQTDGDVAGWRELFSRLGVRDGLIIRKERRTFTAADLASGPWSVESAAWRQSPADGCVIDDYPCEEFRALATADLPGPRLLQQRAALLRLLETNWDTGHRYSQYLAAQLLDGDGRPVRSIKSSFYHYLCRLEWVPAFRPQQGGQQERKYLRPSSVYLTSPEVSSLLGTHVDYVDLDSSEFSRALGMRQTVSVDVLVDYLKKWCLKTAEAEDEDELGGASFTSTVQHIHNVYTYLQANSSQSRLKELFQHTPAVFVEASRLDGDWTSGRFFHLKEVCWSDSTGMFQRYRAHTQRADSPVQEPRVLAPFYSPLKDFFIRLLNVDPSPNMRQYVGLLEVICSSSPIPTAEVLQDVSVLYARLALRCKILAAGEHESISQPRLNPGYCSTLKGMVSDKKVFPTKDNNWVSLARKPMISDSKELEKIFKPRKVCLLNLPPAERKAPSKTKTWNAGERAPPLAFDETDRLLFLEICGICPLSQCVTSESQTEAFRPCPSMQAMVRSVVPYIQRFLYHHDEMSQVYAELTDGNIAAKIKNLSFGQVGRLYIRYQLNQADGEDPAVELQDVICLLKDDKELYIQKDHLSAQLDICRELVKLFCKESSHRKELMHFLSGLIASLSDPRALKRFLDKEDIRELPGGEEPWEVPEPPKPEVRLERVVSRSPSVSVEEAAKPEAKDGEETLKCWPPRAPLQSAAGVRTAHADSGAVDAVMKRWPPPAPPKDLERDAAVRPTGHEGEPIRSGVPSEHPPTVLRHSPHDSTGTPKPPVAEPRETAKAREENQAPPTQPSAPPPPPPPPSPPPPSAPPTEAAEDRPAANGLAAPDAVVLSSTFQGGAAPAQRPPLHLDFPQWSSHATLEDMVLTCQRPTTIVLSDDQTDVAAIGEWGEQLVNSFLTHWMDSADPRRPSQVCWCNQSGESGQPYDFRLSFGETTVFVEVKSTVKRERAFIQLSANELDLALKEKERYHLFRVYSAGDAQNVRLCRIRNLAQHLHTKDLALYLFV
ncbi:protein NO VEIN isoform X2 [Salarias fasciatus]|nr:protein NO VEIN-like isoform X2 [Salarias fasciatus]